MKNKKIVFLYFPASFAMATFRLVSGKEFSTKSLMPFRRTKMI